MGKFIRITSCICISAIFLFQLSSCGPKTTDSTKISVIATTSILGDILHEILPEDIAVEALMGPGVDPHLYKASQGDVKLLSNADIIVYNGLHLEGKMTEVLKNLSRNRDVLAFADIIPKADLRIIDSSADILDPHIWFDLRLSRMALDGISLELAKLLPDHAQEIKSRSQKYGAVLDSLHTWNLNQIAHLDSSSRILITSHDAFGYFGDAYGFEVRGLQGISTLSESGLKDVTNMVNYIIDQKVKAVFVENSVPQKALKSVLEGCQRKGHEVGIGGELFSDALGEDRTPEGTYTGMIRYNVETIVNALK